MSAAPIELRRLRAEDASAYRPIRLEALADSPHAFSSTLESEQDQPLDRFATRLADDFVLGAFSGPHLVGVAVGGIEEAVVVEGAAQGGAAAAEVVRQQPPFRPVRGQHAEFLEVFNCAAHIVI